MLVAIGLLLTALLWNQYQLYGHSSEMDYYRQLSFDQCIRAGILFPRWMPDTYFGYGSPLFHFYGPLPYYITEGFMLLGLGAVTALKATLIATLVLSGLFMYLLCRDFVGPLSAFLAGFAYMIAPYHLVDMLVRHAFGEHVAFAFVPLAAWGLTGMITGRRSVRFPVAALALAALILTHNITAMLGFAALGLWWMLLAIRSRQVGPIAWGAGAVVCGLLIASFFWVPVMAEKDLTYADESLTGGYFVYYDHFVYPSQLLRPSWGFGGSRKGIEGDNMSYQVGIPHLLFVLAAMLFFILGFDRNAHAAWLVGYGLLLFAGALFMTLPTSAFIYRLWPYLAYVQFPWRFLLFVAFASSILAVCLEPLAVATGKPWALPLVIGVAGLLMVGFYGSYTQPKFMIHSEKDQKFRSARVDLMVKLEKSENYQHIWELGGIDTMRRSGMTGTSRDDYLPRTVDRGQKPNALADRQATWKGQGPARVSWRNDGPVDLVANVEAEQSGQVEFARFFFPGWAAFVDGDKVPALPTPQTGTIRVEVPAGKSTVELRFLTTPRRLATGWISLFALAGTVLFSLFLARREQAQGKA